VRGGEHAVVTCGDLVVDGTFTTGEPRPWPRRTCTRSTESTSTFPAAATWWATATSSTLDEKGLSRLSAVSGKKCARRASSRLADSVRRRADWIELDREHFAAQNGKARLNPPSKPVEAACRRSPSPRRKATHPERTPPCCASCTRT
jgi:hypothetical protein